MNVKSVVLILMPIILSACASTDTSTSKTADSDEKTYITGSHIARKNTDGTTADAMQNVTGQQAAGLMRNSVPSTIGGQGVGGK